MIHPLEEKQVRKFYLCAAVAGLLIGCGYVKEGTLVCDISPYPCKEGDQVTVTLKITNYLPVPIILRSVKVRAESPPEMLYADRVIASTEYPTTVECSEVVYLPHVDKLFLKFRRQAVASGEGNWLLLAKKDYEYAKILQPGQRIEETYTFAAEASYNQYLRAQVDYLRLDSPEVKGRLFRRESAPTPPPGVGEYIVTYKATSEVTETVPEQTTYILWREAGHPFMTLRIWTFKIPVKVELLPYGFEKTFKTAKGSPNKKFSFEALRCSVYEYDDGTWFVRSDGGKDVLKGHYVELCQKLAESGKSSCELRRKVTPNDELLKFFEEKGYAKTSGDEAIVSFPISELVAVLRRAEELNCVIYPFSWGEAEKAL